MLIMEHHFNLGFEQKCGGPMLLTLDHFNFVILILKKKTDPG